MTSTGANCLHHNSSSNLFSTNLNFIQGILDKNPLSFELQSAATWRSQRIAFSFQPRKSSFPGNCDSWSRGAIKIRDEEKTGRLNICQEKKVGWRKDRLVARSWKSKLPEKSAKFFLSLQRVAEYKLFYCRITYWINRLTSIACLNTVWHW